MQRPPSARPDGAFCANDLLAVGVLQSLTMLARLRVPDDIALVGYDDIDFAAATVVPLTSIRQPSLLIGKTAVELLVEQIGPEHHEPREVVFQPELIIRESSTSLGLRRPVLSRQPVRPGTGLVAAELQAGAQDRAQILQGAVEHSRGPCLDDDVAERGRLGRTGQHRTPARGPR